MAGKKSAKDSLAKLSRGLTRETPATRTASGAGSRAASGNGDGAARGSGGGARREAAAAVAEEMRPEAPAAEPTTRRRGRPRTKLDRTVRVSVDLPRSDHKYLRDFAYDAESDGMSVMRALLQEMRGDDALAERVMDRLAGE